MKKNKFNAKYIGLEMVNDFTVLYNSKGEYSVIIEIINPVEEYCADIEAYYLFNEIMTSMVRSVGEGYAIQKQDIFSKQTFNKKLSGNEEYLTKEYFNFFKGREYTDIRTFLTITQEMRDAKFMTGFDKKKWKDFLEKIQKVKDLFDTRKLEYSFLSEMEVKEYLHRYLALSFREGMFSFDNIKVLDDSIKVGDKNIKCISLIDVDEVNLPSKIRPYKMSSNKDHDFPQDLMAFLANVPSTETVIYNQVLIIPSQRAENNKLSKKKNRHASLSNPSNDLAVEDITKVQEEIARYNKMLVYAHYNIIVCSSVNESLDEACNFIESTLDQVGITVSKSSYNQLDLFQNSFPGCVYFLNKSYDRFLTLHDAALCLFYKESVIREEDTPLKVYFTSRQGVPKGIDLSGKEGKIKLTTNSNFFCLGPSGSGKSFCMNSVVRQLREQNTDIIMVDTGNSYEGTCRYFNGKYITYTDEKPITMNPFRISRKEYNIEKTDFLKNLIFLMWKGVGGVVSQIEERLMGIVVSEYYASYFTGQGTFSHDEIEELLNDRKQELIEHKIEEGISKSIAIAEADREIVEERENLIKAKEKTHVKELSFNSFFEFACERIPQIAKQKNISIDIDSFKFILEDFYMGGRFERTLNEDFDSSLFEEQFIVFEIDNIKDNKKLFPIVTLIIMDVFIQKMRIKKNRKALIIEEAWKAIASPMMADYIKYLYKTVRKFWGMVGVVTQELNDIIGNEIVKDAIVNNSEITILLDQSKFKERYNEIAQLLGLSDIECRKIWTINSLDNKENRAYFKEVYIRRGRRGDVFGVEEPPHCYITYTTEKVEKDAFKTYLDREENIQTATEKFCADWEKSGCKMAMEFATKYVRK